MKAKQIVALTTTFLVASVVSNIKHAEAAEYTDEITTNTHVLNNPEGTKTTFPNPRVPGISYEEVITYDWTPVTYFQTSIFSYDEKVFRREVEMKNRKEPFHPVIKKTTRYDWGRGSWEPSPKAIPSYEYGNFTKEVFTTTSKLVPVPEPLTIFGTGTALGFGVLLKKRELSKKQKTEAMKA